MKIGLVLLTILTACSPSNNSVSKLNSIQNLCKVSTVHHESEFSQNNILQAHFDEMTVDHLEIQKTDTLPYHVDIDKTYTFTISPSSAVSYITITDAQNHVVTTIHKGDSEVPVLLTAGNYHLNLTGDTNGGLVFITPSHCQPPLPSPALAQVSYEHPGVYIAELPSSESFISQTTSVTAFVGYVTQGASTSPTFVNSYNSYTQRFGSILSHNLMNNAVYQFFANGGDSAYIVGLTPGSDLASGIQLLDTLNNFDLLMIPDLANASSSEANYISQSAIKYVTSKQSFFIANYPSNINTIDSVLNWATQFNSSYAALYFPPTFSGEIAGKYAYNDEIIGVWHAPAGVNETIYSYSAPAPALSNNQISTLLTNNVNPITFLHNYGNIIYGNRTLTKQTELISDISTRRLLNYLVKSLNLSLKWLAFEPNNSNTQKLVTQIASNFLNTMWQTGALFGITAEQAFFVVCDSTNNTPQTMAKGLLYIDVGVATQRPSQFIIIRLSLPTS